MNIIMENVVRYAFNRLTEISTWRSIVLLVLGTWGQNNPEFVDTIVSYSFILIGLLGSLLPDKVQSLAFLKSSKEKINVQVKDTVDTLINTTEPPVIIYEEPNEPLPEEPHNNTTVYTNNKPVSVTTPRLPEYRHNVVQPVSVIKGKTTTIKPTKQPEPEVGFGDKN